MAKIRGRLLAKEPKVIARWMHFKVSVIEKSLGRRWARIKIRYSPEERKRRRLLEETFDNMRNIAFKFERKGFDAPLTVLNVGLYFLIAERDIQTVKLDALTHPDWWTRKLALRLILLTLHEWDMDKVSGQRLRDAMKAIDASEAIQTEVWDALRDVRRAQRRAKKQLGFLRNATIAHRDPDALAQFNAIRDLDEDLVWELMVGFYEGSRRFISLVPRLVLKTGSLTVLIEQLRKHPSLNPESGGLQH